MELKISLLFVNTILFCYGCFPNPSTGTSPTMVTGPMYDPSTDPTLSCNACPAAASLYDSINSDISCMVNFMPCTMNNKIMVRCDPPLCKIEFSSSNGMDTATMMQMKDITCTGSGMYTSSGVPDVTSIRCNP